MHATGVGTARNCEMAVSLFKNVAERGHWSLELATAAKAFQAGEADGAIVRYLVRPLIVFFPFSSDDICCSATVDLSRPPARDTDPPALPLHGTQIPPPPQLLAEMGYEIAQHNAAFVLEEEGFSPLASENGTYKRALVNWRRSAGQGEFSARVKIGDYLYYGRGTEVDMVAAADEYRTAADASNPQAMFNLAYMHEHGEGLPHDLHLAKRYYDMSLNTNAESQVGCRPGSLSSPPPLLYSLTFSANLRLRKSPACHISLQWRSPGLNT